MKRVTVLRQEIRPPRFANLIVDHHRPDTSDRWLQRAYGFIAGVAFAGVLMAVWMS